MIRKKHSLAVEELKVDNVSENLNTLNIKGGKK